MQRFIVAAMVLGLIGAAAQADHHEGLLEVSAAIMEAWNHGRPEALAQHFADDNKGFGGDGGILQGVDAQRAHEMFASGYRVQLQLVPDDVQLVGDVALTTGYLKGTMVDPAMGAMRGTWRATAVWVKREGAWKLLHWHHSPLSEQVRPVRGDMPPERMREAMRRRMRGEDREEMRREGEDHPAAVIMVRHKVEDWERWQTAFKEAADMRVEMGSMGSYVWRNADDPNEVFVSVQARNPERAVQFLQSEELKQAMMAAGVVDEPTIWMVDARHIHKAAETEEWRTGEHAVFVRHKVDDLERWLDVFQEHAEMRVDAGSQGGFAMFHPNRSDDDVLVFLNWKNVDAAREFVGSAGLAEAMAAAGVADEPDIWFLNLALEMDR